MIFSKGSSSDLHCYSSSSVWNSPGWSPLHLSSGVVCWSHLRIKINVHSRQIPPAHLSPHPGLSHLTHDQCEDEGHLHEGGAVTAGQEAAGDGEAVEGEDDPQRDAAQGV